jgi:hypothetical protein
VLKHEDDIVKIMTMEAGKPLSEARAEFQSGWGPTFGVEGHRFASDLPSERLTGRQGFGVFVCRGSPSAHLPSVCLSARPSVCPCALCLTARPSVHVSVRLSVCLSVLSLAPPPLLPPEAAVAAATTAARRQ